MLTVRDVALYFGMTKPSVTKTQQTPNEKGSFMSMCKGKRGQREKMRRTNKLPLQNSLIDPQKEGISILEKTDSLRVCYCWLYNPTRVS